MAYSFVAIGDDKGHASTHLQIGQSKKHDTGREGVHDYKKADRNFNIESSLIIGIGEW